MSRLRTRPDRFARALLVAALALLAGCENILDAVPDEGLRGLVVLDGSGSEVARFVAPSTSTGSISVGAGQSRSFRVMLLGANDEVVPIAGSYELREPVVLLVPIATAALEGSDRVRVSGQRAGNTTLVLDVRQGLQTVIRGADIPIRVGG